MPRKLDERGIVVVIGRYNQTVPLFPGNAQVPILKTIDQRGLVELLNNATTNEPVADPATDLLNLMINHSWCITAGVHRGGLGGAAGGADPEPHISLSVNAVGYHLRVKLKAKTWVLWDITGPTPPAAGAIRLSKGKQAAADRNAAPVVSAIDTMRINYGLTEREALRAYVHMQKHIANGGNDITAPTAAKWVINQR
ncbi:hypothetical protein [Pseudomonas sp. FEN]|uniref:hypothetical protein n=1 Tax=Pseudomonas sp. FEN TaxID=2767468 RepID=UPI001749FA1A|nr:hypothetical protein [Pseudomonas sp. FEN]CAD5201035.1 hypothetical protein [Pseudomonas sp. FEN]